MTREADEYHFSSLMHLLFFRRKEQSFYLRGNQDSGGAHAYLSISLVFVGNRVSESVLSLHGLAPRRHFYRTLFVCPIDRARKEGRTDACSKTDSASQTVDGLSESDNNSTVSL